MASHWLAPHQVHRHFRIHTDTTDFFRVEYDDVVILKRRHGGLQGHHPARGSLTGEKDCFLTSTEKEKWLTQYREKIDTLLKGCWQI